MTTATMQNQARPWRGASGAAAPGPDSKGAPLQVYMYSIRLRLECSYSKIPIVSFLSPLAANRDLGVGVYLSVFHACFCSSTPGRRDCRGRPRDDGQRAMAGCRQDAALEARREAWTGRPDLITHVLKLNCCLLMHAGTQHAGGKAEGKLYSSIIYSC